MKDLISIVVTSYNHANFLDQRMTSLLQQTYENIEIIVVDDCSTDNSLAVLNKYRQYNNVQIIAHNTNKGYALASNHGAGLCRGKYIMFAECDDFNEPAQIATLHHALTRKSHIGVAYCRSTMVDANGTKHGDDFQGRDPDFKIMCKQETLIPRNNMQRFLLQSCVIPNMSAALIKIAYFNQVGGLSPAYHACADWDFWCRIAKHCDFYYIPTALNSFRSHGTTVRERFSIMLQVSEMYRLLYDAAVSIHLSPAERCRFKINTGAIWGQHLRSHPCNWLKSFPSLCRITFHYDACSILYLLLAAIKRAYALCKQIIIKKTSVFLSDATGSKNV